MSSIAGGQEPAPAYRQTIDEVLATLATDALTHCRLPGGMTNSRAGSVLTARAALAG